MRTAEYAEIVALDVFNRPDRQPVTMSMVQRRIGELQTHRPSCPRMLDYYTVTLRALAND